MPNITQVFVSELNVTAPSSPPAITGLTATAERQAVLFLWTAASISPYYWQYRLQVESNGWSAWIRTETNSVRRELTLAEKTAVDNTIAIEVRTTDGVTNGATSTVSTDVLSDGIVAGDVADGSITPVKLHADTIARIFSSATRSGGDLAADNSITAGMIAPDAVGASELANDAVDTNAIVNLAVTTGKINDLAVTTGKIAALAVDNSKLAADAVTTDKILANTIATGDLATSVTDRMFEANGRAKLDAVLPVTVNNLDATDRIGIIVGTNKNLVANAASIKTDLSLNLVQNKTSATIRSEIVDGDLAATTALLTGAWQAFIDAAGQNDTIDKDAIETVKASHIQLDAAVTPVFDASGNLLIGIKSGGTTITAANIISAINTSGQCKNFLLTGATYSGTLDDIPETGSDKTVTANEKTGAGRAYSALNSSNELTTGTTNKTVAEIEAYVHDDRGYSGEEVFDTTSPAYSVYAPTGAGIGTEVDFHLFMMRRQSGDNYIYIRFSASSQDALGIVGAEMLNESEVAFGTPVKDEEAISHAGYPAYQTYTISLPYSSNVAVGDWACVRVYVEETIGQTINVKKIRKWNAYA